MGYLGAKLWGHFYETERSTYQIQYLDDRTINSIGYLGFGV